MKAIFAALFCFLLFTGATAQNVSYGISVGITNSEFDLQKDLSLSNQIEALETSSKFGFNLGIQALIKVANRVKISPQLLIDFSERSIETTFINDLVAPRTLELARVRAPIDLQLELLRGATSLYLISGVEYVYDLNSNDDLRGSFFDLKENFWSGRLGIGIRKNFQRFSVSPELTFVKSLNDIEGENIYVLNEVVTSLDDTMIGFSIKFQGLLSD